MAISSIQTMEVPDTCHKWLENRGAVYQLLTEVLGHWPTLSLVAQWSRGSAISKAAQLTRGGRMMFNYLRNSPPEMLVRITETEGAEYRRLLQYSHPITESYYSGLSRAQNLSDFYASAGIAFKKISGEPDDHVSIELEFMTILHDRMLNSSYSEDSMVELMGIQIQFLEKHLLSWIPTLCRELKASATSPLYLAVAEMLEEFLELDLSMLRIWRHSLVHKPAAALREPVLV